jgi:hypothetical protein
MPFEWTGSEILSHIPWCLCFFNVKWTKVCSIELQGSCVRACVCWLGCYAMVASFPPAKVSVYKY